MRISNSFKSVISNKRACISSADTSYLVNVASSGLQWAAVLYSCNRIYCSYDILQDTGLYPASNALTKERKGWCCPHEHLDSDWHSSGSNSWPLVYRWSLDSFLSIMLCLPFNHAPPPPSSGLRCLPGAEQQTDWRHRLTRTRKAIQAEPGDPRSPRRAGRARPGCARYTCAKGNKRREWLWVA